MCVQCTLISSLCLIGISLLMNYKKVDGLSEDFKMDTQRDIHARATDDLYDAGIYYRFILLQKLNFDFVNYIIWFKKIPIF